MKRLVTIVLLCAWSMPVLGQPVGDARAPAAPVYRSPLDLKYSPDGKTIAVSDRTAAKLVLIDPAAKKVAREVALNGQGTGVAWSADGSKVYVGERNAGTVAEVIAASGKIARRLPVGLRPMGIAVVAKRNLLIVANTVTHDVSVVDLATGKEKARIAVVREPYFVAVTPDEKTAVVGNLLPRGNASDPQTASMVSLIDLETMKPVAAIKLPGGSTALRQVAVSPDGKWAYGVHTVGRTTLPTTQLERGWVNTNAMSVIDLPAKTLLATLLLDRLSEGAADPWGVALSKDGKTLWTSIAGVHQVAKVDLEGLHLLLEGKDLPPLPGQQGPRYVSDIWKEIKKDPKRREFLVNDLAALYGAGLLMRKHVDGKGPYVLNPDPFGKALKGPRGIDLSPDGKTLAVAMHFAGRVALMDAETLRPGPTIEVGPNPDPDQVRVGEIIFHDATYCFQHWLSCASCHPEDIRPDGLNWDLLNDGLGNPKNARSLLWSYKTPPVMSRGVRDKMETAVAAGFRYIQFHEPTPETLRAVETYLKAVKPVPSPYLTAKGELSDSAKRGMKVFEGKAACAACHPGPLFTDLKLYNVGTRAELDRADEFDTPTLVELYKTAPYLHSGEAVTLDDVVTTFNKKDQHGTTTKLSKQERDDLVAYLLSL